MIQPFSPNWNESNFLQVNHSQSQALTPSRDRSNRVATCSSCKQKKIGELQMANPRSI